MPIQSDIQQRLSRSADALVRAVRKQIDRWLREGVSLQEILTRLSAFRLPPGERQKLERAVRASMEEIAKARALDLPTEHIDALIAARQISIGNIQHQMQADLQQEVRRALVAGYGPDVLRRRLEERGFANAETEAQTAVSRFNNLLTFENAAVTGTRTFKYFGPVSAITRPFCRAHAGQVFTEEEIRKMDNGQGLPVSESCGGYNCRHYWIAVPDGRKTENGGQRSEVRIGKQTFLMNDEQKQALFTRERSLWIQTPEASAGKNVEWHMAAKPLARAHDGFNEYITGQPSEGVWVPKANKGYIEHARKHSAEFGTEYDYRRTMAGTLRNPSAKVYEDAISYLVHDPGNDALLIISKGDGLLESAYRWDREKWPDQFKGKRLLGTVREFLGDFR